jgi:hypothetical protein
VMQKCVKAMPGHREFVDQILAHGQTESERTH